MKPHAQSSGRRARPRPPRLEPLEDRRTPSDATAATLVKDINPGPDWSHIYWMTDLNGTLVFSGYDGGGGFQGVELFRSDGTSAGTTVLAGVEGLGPFTVIGNTTYFEGEDASSPTFELFKTDGTPAGTGPIDPGGGPWYPTDLTDVNGTLFFNGYDPAHGAELWKTDGAVAGTVLVKDVNPGGDGSNPGNLTDVNGTLFFTAADGTSAGFGLWKSDGTAAGTVFLKSFRGAGALTNVNGTLLFSADDGSHGAELWTSDGTAKGTKMVKDLYSGSTTLNEHYYGHFHVKVPNSSSPSNLVNVNGTLFFTAYEPTHGGELWKSDGTAKGTVLVADIVPGANSSSPAALTNVNGAIYFAADTGAGRELWKSDGTAAGTAMVKDINPVGSSSPGHLTNADGTVYFSADDGTHGFELWKTDGTSAGTVLVRDINPGDASSSPAVLTVSGGHLFFTADDGVHGTELWDPPVAPAPAGGGPLDSANFPLSGASAADATCLLADGLITPPPDGSVAITSPPGPWNGFGSTSSAAEVSGAGEGTEAVQAPDPILAGTGAPDTPSGLGLPAQNGWESGPARDPTVSLDLD
jgi:trimeric autotransporter adhesin